jgi:hypothetical protein
MLIVGWRERVNALVTRAAGRALKGGAAHDPENLIPKVAELFR